MGFRKCSQCEKTGHNSRTCHNMRTQNNGESVKLFGVELASLASPNDGLGFTKSISLPTLIPSSCEINSYNKLKNGYPHSHGSIGTSQKIRKNGVAWSEDEHKLFLLGIQKLGKGDWKGISSKFVRTRTPTQVASHAQKYFLRQNNAKKNKYIRPNFLSLVERNEDSINQVNTKEPSISQSFPIIYKKSNFYKFKMPEIPSSCRLFTNCATQNSVSLELSLAAPQPPVWNIRPVSFWQMQCAENRTRQPVWDA